MSEKAPIASTAIWEVFEEEDQFRLKLRDSDFSFAISKNLVPSLVQILAFLQTHKLEET